MTRFLFLAEGYRADPSMRLLPEMTHNSLRIRPALLSDSAVLPAIERSAALLFAEVPGYEDFVTKPVIDQMTHARWMTEGAYLIAESSFGRRVAFLAARCSGGVVTILEVSVRRSYQRRGIGRALLARCLRDAERDWVDQVWLGANLAFEWNAPLYGAMGFLPADGEPVPIAVRNAAWDDPRCLGGPTGKCGWMVSRTDRLGR